MRKYTFPEHQGQCSTFSSRGTRVYTTVEGLSNSNYANVATLVAMQEQTNQIRLVKSSVLLVSQQGLDKIKSLLLRFHNSAIAEVEVLPFDKANPVADDAFTQDLAHLGLRNSRPKNPDQLEKNVDVRQLLVNGIEPKQLKFEGGSVVDMGSQRSFDFEIHVSRARPDLLGSTTLLTRALRKTLIAVSISPPATVASDCKGSVTGRTVSG
jgi:hypothetical protein